MSRRLAQASVLAPVLLATVYLAVHRPGYFSQVNDLSMLIFLQLLAAAIWNYKVRFFPVLLMAFLWAAVDLPFNVLWTSGRWFVLGVGTLAGVIVYFREHVHTFSKFHLVAMFCVVAAFVSAIVSTYSHVAILKSVSLLLLFLYCCSGARVAVMGREEVFFSRLLIGCEVLVCATAVSYFVLRVDWFGNLNSLGAVMGVVAVPLLLWGILVSRQPAEHWRRIFIFLLAMALLFSSYARAGIAAGAVACILLCVATRRYSLLAKGTALAILLAAFVMSTIPLPDRPSQSLTSVFLYKGRREEGILGSRKPVWNRTLSVIEEHPWFGSGFGTSLTSFDFTQPYGTFTSTREATREHGNSYLAITEWVGLLGVIPFMSLVLLIMANVARVITLTRKTGDLFSPALPLAIVLIAGLVHAAFEDWLFAVGYYLCVFFWSMAFIMVDVLDVKAVQQASVMPSLPLESPHSYGYAVVGR